MTGEPAPDVLDEVRSLQQLARGVVHGAHQAELRTTAFEPVVWTAIPLHHQPCLRHRLSAPEQPLNRSTADLDLLVLTKLLGEVLVVEASVSVSPKPDDLITHGIGDSVRGSSSGVAMVHTAVSLLLVPTLLLILPIGMVPGVPLVASAMMILVAIQMFFGI